MEQIVAKLENLNVNLLKEMAEKLSNILSPEADIVLSAVLDQLMVKMNEDEFVTFTETL